MTESIARQLPDGATCERIVHAALAAGDMPGVEAALQVMAVTDPARAGELVEIMRTGLDLAGRAVLDVHREGEAG